MAGVAPQLAYMAIMLTTDMSIDTILARRTLTTALDLVNMGIMWTMDTRIGTSLVQITLTTTPKLVRMVTDHHAPLWQSLRLDTIIL